MKRIPPLEEIFRTMNIQGNLTDLLSKDPNEVQTALRPLASVAQMGQRRECLYALLGYYLLEVKTLEDRELFFQVTHVLFSPELFFCQMKDLIGIKDLARRRLFTHELCSHLSRVFAKADEANKVAMLELIEGGQWGEKLKEQFRRALGRGKQPKRQEERWDDDW